MFVFVVPDNPFYRLLQIKKSKPKVNPFSFQSSELTICYSPHQAGTSMNEVNVCKREKNMGELEVVVCHIFLFITSL